MAAGQRQRFDATTLHAGFGLADRGVLRREAEAGAAAYDEQQIIFDNAKAVGILFASDRMVRRCNRRLAEIFGYEAEELAGRSTRVFFLARRTTRPCCVPTRNSNSAWSSAPPTSPARTRSCRRKSSSACRPSSASGRWPTTTA
ncbi:MAG: PAS domain S-box protein [Sulfuritalea sp.]|nr:PAS domain S-box protein [Sulfuritalea sp.]